MQAPGLYWVSADREVDAKSFCQQVISSQPAETRAALIILLRISSVPTTLMGPTNFLSILCLKVKKRYFS